jgi:nucleotide-binding universal stress UspA family protein
MARPSILVGIDGSPAAWRALEWAAECERTRRHLDVVHVGDVLADPGAADSRAYGRALLDDAIATLADDHSEVDAGMTLKDGRPAAVLLELVAGADLVVVGRGWRGVPGVQIGSVANKVLAHATCPTAVVPASADVRTNRVAVGVSNSPGGMAAIRFAADEAAKRGAELVAVRSWLTREWRLAAAAALPISPADVWQQLEQTTLDSCLRPVRDTLPHLQVRCVLSGAAPEIVLEQQARGAAMVVLGCRRADDGRFPRLGPISSWAAHHFDCPVVVVGSPNRRHSASAEDVGEIAAGV